jgi:hypothetical protein
VGRVLVSEACTSLQEIPKESQPGKDAHNASRSGHPLPVAALHKPDSRPWAAHSTLSKGEEGEEGKEGKGKDSSGVARSLRFLKAATTSLFCGIGDLVDLT